MNIAYIRVSTEEQNEARQTEAMQGYAIDRYFVEKKSGKNMDRPQLQAMIDYARSGDVVYVHSLDRLARSTADLLKIVEQLQAKGVELHSNKESIDTSTATGKLMLTMIGAIAEFERANLLERQREGIAIAKENGAYKGRQAKVSPLFDSLYEAYKQNAITVKAMADEMKVSRATVYSWIKAKEQ